VTRVLVTGASGFIGTAFCSDAVAKGWKVRAAVRRPSAALAPGVEQCAVGDVTDAVWEPALADIDAVLHLAGIAHELKGPQAEAVYHAVNCAATERLARAAARCGVRRFLFLSSIKVNGERTASDRPFRPGDEPRPQDRYARSKREAERVLAQVAAQSKLEVAIIRPPLVYGPGVGANFLRLIALVSKGIPLPFGSIRNRRSLLYVGNLAALLAACALAPQAAGRTLLAADGQDVSTPELIKKIALALGRRARLWPFPASALRALGALCGQADKIDRLVESLAVDASETRSVLQWQPRFTVEQGIEHTVAWYDSRRAA
jgi:UDP-N-acetyl-alpha-D-quinovosamine dehydrogenase